MTAYYLSMVIPKSFQHALRNLKKRAIEHAEAIRETAGDTRNTQEMLDDACLYFLEMCPKDERP